MPSDANGVYSLPSGSTAVTGEIIQASTHNTPIEDIASAMSQRLIRSGVAPMTGPLKIVDGAVGSPAVKFSTDGTTGFYKTTNGIGVSVGGTKVAEFTSSGASRMIGELIPWILSSLPDGWVFPYGQTLSRTTYADLWVIAQDEISNGSSFFNNGNGTTTFGIGDMRGRVPAGKDDMGGSAASRLTSTYFGADATVLGAAGGSQTNTIVTANLPPYTPSGTVSGVSVTSNFDIQINQSGVDHGAPTAGPNDYARYSPGRVTSTGTGNFNGAAQGGTSTPFRTTQPTLICNYILYAGA
jgi:microcystin-dependent protein